MSEEIICKRNLDRKGPSEWCDNCEDENVFKRYCDTKENLTKEKASTAIVEREKKEVTIAKAESLVAGVETMLKEHGIDVDFKAMQEAREKELFPALPKDMRGDAMAVIVQSRGLFATSNMGHAHQEDIPEFDDYPCDECGTEIGMEHTYWVALGNMEYLRIICPKCNTKVLPEGIDIEKASRLNEKDPSIIEARKKTGIPREEKESVLDVETDDEK